MIRSKSSSLLNGMLIFPLPFGVQESCTFEPKKPQRCFCNIMYSSESLFPADLIFCLRFLSIHRMSAP